MEVMSKMKCLGCFGFVLILWLLGWSNLRAGQCLWVCTGFRAVVVAMPVEVGEPPQTKCYGFRNPLTEEDGDPPAQGFVYARSGQLESDTTMDMITRVEANSCGTPDCAPWGMRVVVHAYHLPQDGQETPKRKVHPVLLWIW